MINIFDRQRQLKINKLHLRSLVTFALKSQDCPQDTIVNLMYVRDQVIRKYNRDFLGHDYATDVISFKAEYDPLDGDDNKSIGDIMVSVDTARQYAQDNKIDVGEELARYTLHGILHCLGFEDYEDEKREEMFKVQESILNCWIKETQLNICDH